MTASSSDLCPVESSDAFRLMKRSPCLLFSSWRPLCLVQMRNVWFELVAEGTQKKQRHYQLLIKCPYCLLSSGFRKICSERHVQIITDLTGWRIMFSLTVEWQSLYHDSVYWPHCLQSTFWALHRSDSSFTPESCNLLRLRSSSFRWERFVLRTETRAAQPSSVTWQSFNLQRQRF